MSSHNPNIWIALVGCGIFGEKYHYVVLIGHVCHHATPEIRLKIHLPSIAGNSTALHLKIMSFIFCAFSGSCSKNNIIRLFAALVKILK
ncbi:hypothetical protein ACJX0J_028493, partial [Zea mays]